MILLLGASGYVGRAFASELRRQGQSFVPLSRRAFDYSRFDYLFDYLRTMRPEFVINAASAESASFSVASEAERERMMATNATLPQVIARACLITRTPWGHVSSGAIYRGAKVMKNGEMTVQLDLNDLEQLALFDSHPEQFLGFTESDEPNSSFLDESCDFYSGTKALAEESIRDLGQSYVWRFGLTFDETPEPGNWLWQVQRQREVLDTIHSFSRLQDCVKGCLELYQRRASFGIYNVTNPGAISTGQVALLIRRYLRCSVRLTAGWGAPCHPGCILDEGKLLRAGVKLRTAEAALKESLELMREAARFTKRASTPTEEISEVGV